MVGSAVYLKAEFDEFGRVVQLKEHMARLGCLVLSGLSVCLIHLTQWERETLKVTLQSSKFKDRAARISIILIVIVQIAIVAIVIERIVGRVLRTREYVGYCDATTFHIAMLLQLSLLLID